MITTQNIQRFVAATALATGLLSAGVAASAQTTAAPANAPASANATSVSMATVSSNPSRQVRLDRINADARRVEFRNLGTSL